MITRTGKPLVIGVSGQVGSHLVRALGNDGCVVSSRNPDPKAALTVDLAGLRTAEDAERALGPHPVNAIYCVGGMTAVDACESASDLAFATNCRGPASLAQVAAKRGIPFVYFSTEYVFDGSAGPYMEDDRANPISVYGRSKWEGEQAVLAACPTALVLRTTVVYGEDSGQKNYVYTLMRVLGARKQIRVPKDQISTPTYNRDLARATLELVRAGASGIYHVCGPERMDRVEFAQRVAQFLGLDERLLIAVPTSELGQAAPRPLSAGLSTEKLRRMYPQIEMRPLEKSMDDCGDALKQFLQTAEAPSGS